MQKNKENGTKSSIKRIYQRLYQQIQTGILIKDGLNLQKKKNKKKNKQKKQAGDACEAHWSFDQKKKKNL